MPKDAVDYEMDAKPEPLKIELSEDQVEIMLNEVVKSRFGKDAIVGCVKNTWIIKIPVVQGK